LRYLAIILFLYSGACLGQTKMEYEKKVDEAEIPVRAKQDLYNCFEEEVKVKWFFQKDGKKKVYEAKFNYKNSSYSVEFDLDGDIENVEVLLTENDMDPNILKNITTSIEKEFTDFKILKIQEEFIGDEEELFAIIRGELVDDIDINYEIEVNAKQKKRRNLYEVILDRDFKVLSKRKVKLQSTDILDY